MTYNSGVYCANSWYDRGRLAKAYDSPREQKINS